MSELTIFNGLIIAWLVTAAVTFLALLFISAPYGRHGRSGWGPQIPATLGWILMEAPSPLGMTLLFVLATPERHRNPAAIAFLALWLVHYINRAFVFPFRMRNAGKTMPAAVALMAVVFNLGNAYLNGRWLFHFSPLYPDAWLTDPRFLVGVALFFAGFAINQHSDWVLLHLRKPGETGYKIPRGGLYRFVSCPNYFGEVLEWTGWALATWCVAGVTFAVWTAANLVPRAITHHRWYREQFPDYPSERRAVFPYVL